MTVPSPATNIDGDGRPALRPAIDSSDSATGPVETAFDVQRPKRPRPRSAARASRRELPSWLREQLPRWGERVRVPEWDEDESIDGEGGAADHYERGEGEMDCYRSTNGWKGTDLCHSIESPVRISHYGVRHEAGGVGTTLSGAVHFTSGAESHAGYCHGGSMTAVMDDVIGWTAFLVTGKCIPWSGFTAQVNVSLRRPIAVRSYLKVVGRITKWEGRKVWIHSQLIHGGDEDGEGTVHCTAEGLVILKRNS
ncbi:hypothetical protein ACHAWF_009468 [Thalassiosira exigua]